MYSHGSHVLSNLSRLNTVSFVIFNFPLQLNVGLNHCVARVVESPWICRIVPQSSTGVPFLHEKKPLPVIPSALYGLPSNVGP